MANTRKMIQPRLCVGEERDWTDLPLHNLIYEWCLKNMNLPSDMGTLVAYIGLFLITWYAVVWAVRLVMSIIWPIFIISTAIIVFRIMQSYEPDELLSMVMKAFTIIADTLVTVLARTLEFALSFIE